MDLNFFVPAVRQRKGYLIIVSPEHTENTIPKYSLNVGKVCVFFVLGFCFVFLVGWFVGWVL